MSAITPDGRKIITDYWMKPIPSRCHDWTAVTEDYDGAPDAGWPSSCIGSGATEAEAIADLIEQTQPEAS